MRIPSFSLLLVLSFHAAALAVVDPKRIIPTEAPQSARVMIVGSEMDNPSLSVWFPLRLDADGTAEVSLSVPVVSRLPQLMEVIVPRGAISGPVIVRLQTSTIRTFNFTVSSDPSIVTVTTIAGGPGTSSFTGPTGILMDATGTQFVGDTSTHQIKKVSTSGQVAVFAGSGAPGFTNGTGLSAKFRSPSEMLVMDSQGNLYVSDTGNHAIRKVTSAGVVTTVAGGTAGDADGPLSAARFRSPKGIAVDSSGTLYVADTDNKKIRKISGSTVSTIATLTAKPRGIAIARGYIYVTAGHQILQVTMSGTVMEDSGSSTSGFTDGNAAASRFKDPAGIVSDSEGANLYVADTGNHVIRKIDVPWGPFSDSITSTIAGSYPTIGYSNGPPLSAQFSTPTGVSLQGFLGVTDKANRALRGLFSEVRLTAIYPNYIPLGGSQIRLFGTGFTPTSTVRIGTAVATSTYVSSTLLLASAPPSSAGAVDVSVTTPAGMATLAAGLGYAPPPTIGSITPARGSSYWGTDVTITGNGFIEAGTTVYFGSNLSPIVTVGSSSSLTAKAPSVSNGDFAGFVDVRIITSSGEVTRSNGFEYVPYPKITGFSPTKGPLGATIRIFLAQVAEPDSIGVTHGAPLCYCDTGDDGFNTKGTPTHVDIRLVNNFLPEPITSAPGKFKLWTPWGFPISQDTFTVLGTTSLSVTPQSANLTVGATLQLTAVAHLSDGTTHGVTHETAYTSSNTSVASVGDDFWNPTGEVGGLVKALSPGNATITANFPSSFDPPIYSTTVEIQVHAAEPVPPDPSTVAPPIDPAVATGFAEATNFLYTGENPIQTGVVAGTIEPARAAVVRGRVLSGSGAALPAVRISVLNHPELGQTLSRADGRYDLAVNGGGHLTLRFEKSGYIFAQRQIDTPWRDFIAVEDVVLLQYDAQVTNWTAGAAEAQVARGGVMTDSDGARRATMIMSAGTSATITLPDGSTQSLSSLSVRATELSVGQSGPRAMPAALPPQSGYTYCVELSADEAVNAGATKVTFSKPLAFYVENFLNFPVGGFVPAGYYDRVRGVWIASNNGVVLKILSTDGGSATLDTNGDGAADSEATLTGLGIDAAERQRLATLYAPAQMLWRVPIPHFTPWDLNWPYGPPSTAKPPEQGKPIYIVPVENPCAREGSIIECENQTLGESIPIVGTPLRLEYRSDRVKGHTGRYTLQVPLSGASLPPGVKRIEREIAIAGRQFADSYPASTNLTTEFSWDGMDVYGRSVPARQRAIVRTGYVYDAEYYQPQDLLRSFGSVSGVPLTGNRARQEVTLWQESNVLMGTWRNPVEELGGWNLSAHHKYDPRTQDLYRGDGVNRRAEGVFNDVVTTIAGGDLDGESGDGGPAIQATIGWGMAAIVVAPDGSIYLCDQSRHRIRKIDPQGIITTVVGNGVAGFGGDGGPATAAQLNNPSDIALGPDGSLYVVDHFNKRIRRVAPDGMISTIAGSGSPVYGGDGGPATEAGMSPFALAIAPDGTIFAGDSVGSFNSHRIRRISDGVITTYGGTGGNHALGDGGPALSARIALAHDLLISSDGSLFISCADDGFYGGGFRIRRISPSGIIMTIAGTGGFGSAEDGLLATSTEIFPRDLAFGPDGTLFISQELSTRIRAIDPERIVSTRVGGGVLQGNDAENSPGGALYLSNADGIAAAPDGALYFADAARIRKLHPALPSGLTGDTLIASDTTGEIFSFSNGRHLRTVDPLTAANLYVFGYNATGHLITIDDRDGQRITVERNSSGQATALVAPGGQRTILSYDANDYLASITSPANELHGFTYTPGGLMLSHTNPRNQTSQFTYDTGGLLVRDQDAAGGYSSITRIASGDDHSVTLTSAGNRSWVHEVERNAKGELVRSVRNPAGILTRTTTRVSGEAVTASPDGTTGTVSRRADPRWGMQSPVSGNVTITTPAGRTLTTTETRSVTLSEPGNPLSLTRESTNLTLNSRIFTSVYEAATRKITTTTPESRQAFVTLDVKGRPSEAEAPGLTKLQYGYEARGFLSSLTEGTRTTSFAYDPAGNLASVTDPLSRTVSFAYDLAGRVTSQTLPDSRVIGFSYDANGNLTSITPPGRPGHTFGYTTVDLESLYTPPPIAGTGATQYVYNLDRDLTQVIRPDGATIDLGYDTGGRLSTLITPAGGYSYTYAANGNLSLISAPGGISTSYSFDGVLPTGSSWSGAVSGSVGRSYDNDFRASSETVNSGSAVSFGYDGDSLLAAAGALTLTRDAQNGLLTGTALMNTADSYSYNTFGEVTGYTASYNTVPVFSITYTRDSGGRVNAKTETISGVTTSFGYAYDTAGRLTSVTRDTTPISTYTYDSNSNRLTHNVTSGTYDAQDRLLTNGEANFTYTANGELLTRIDGSGTTSYEYDALGNLRKVTLPDATMIDYVIDGQNRRIGRKLNGMLTHGWLYADQLRIVAELDGTGAVISRFVYGSRTNTPDYMVKGGTTYRIISDHLGSPRLVMDATTGMTMQRLDYDEFGNVTTDTNPGFQPFGFAGGLYDTQTKLVRFGARDYDPHVGRWTVKDPISFDGGNTNLFGYVAGEPINRVDSSGLATCVVIWTQFNEWHSAVKITSGNDGPALYDPSGSYPGPPGSEPPGSGRVFIGNDASLAEYLNYWRGQSSPEPKIFCFGTTPAEERSIYGRMNDLGGGGSMSCATNVSTALEGIGPFSNLKPTFWPPALANQLEKARRKNR